MKIVVFFSVAIGTPCPAFRPVKPARKTAPRPVPFGDGIEVGPAALPAVVASVLLADLARVFAKGFRDRTGADVPTDTESAWWSAECEARDAREYDAYLDQSPGRPIGSPARPAR